PRCPTPCVPCVCTGSSPDCLAPTPMRPRPTACASPPSTPSLARVCSRRCWPPTIRRRPLRSAAPLPPWTALSMTTSPTPALAPQHETCHNVTTSNPQERLAPDAIPIPAGSMSSAVSFGTEPVEDDREGAGLQALIQVAAFGGQARADQQRGHLGGVDVVAHRASPVGGGP